MSKFITLAEVARDLKITPKNARRIARSRTKELGKRKAPWTFPASKREHVVRVLRGQ